MLRPAWNAFGLRQDCVWAGLEFISKLTNSKPMMQSVIVERTLLKPLNFNVHKQMFNINSPIPLPQNIYYLNTLYIVKQLI